MMLGMQRGGKGGQMTQWHSAKRSCRESLRACLETKHFHSSFGPRVIFLSEKWKIPLTDGKKNNLSWTNPETKIPLKVKKDRGLGGNKYLF